MPLDTTSTTQAQHLQHLQDSIDSVKQAHYYAPRYPKGLPQVQAGNTLPRQRLDQLPVVQVPDGRAPQPQATSPLHDTACMAMLLLGMLAVAVSYKTGYKYIESFMHNMFSVRRRDNLFDDHTMSETTILTALVVNTCIMQALLLYYAFRLLIPSLGAAMQAHVALYSGVLLAGTLLFYLLQLGFYYVLGYVFASGGDTQIWLGGFKATQSLLGLLLLPVVIVTMVYPGAIKAMLAVALLLYVCARIVFVCKGFRIFFNKLTSGVYFILYLCSAEIVPPVVFTVGMIAVCNILQS